MLVLATSCHDYSFVYLISSALFVGSKAGGIGSKAGGIGSAAAGQPGLEGDSLLSKVLPGGAAEQAGKLGEGEDGELSTLNASAVHNT